MNGSFSIFMVIVPFVMIFMAIRAIRALTSDRRNQYLNNQNDEHRAYESIAVDVKRLGRDSGPRYSTDGIESKIFKLALAQKGILTVSDVVIEIGLSVSDSEKILEGMADGTHVKMELSKNGIVQYEFPEIIQRFEK